MRRRCVFAIALVLIGGSAALADSLPPQPPPVANPLGTGDEKERAACAPDVVKYCKHELDANANAGDPRLPADQPAKDQRCLQNGAEQSRAVSRIARLAGGGAFAAPPCLLH
jgi:hypothetical protein